MVKELLKELKEKGVQLVAVSKTHPPAAILGVYELGQRAFGENKAQELSAKQVALPQDIAWHFIGHLQTNKIKYIAPFVHLIHAVDSLKLLEAINKEAQRNNRIISCLLQIKIAQEESKYGLSYEEAEALLKDKTFSELENIRIAGVMGMATYTDDEAQIRSEFRTLKQYFDQLKRDFFFEDTAFCELSMGMSHDYRIAIEEGSTMVRIGSLIFGERVY
ncbi:MAG TPA: YggS family pyridoxal phosphate-dependent enzyme [Saprospiraceae bacterium]|nr:YggS family pyridoxal phosphate-dependent enzyme [Saprospiraceae bacterium]HMQ85321.1 YggS family pyridoxal phosphate-dependent enzyme [Saprospiraceae bacterium]